MAPCVVLARLSYPGRWVTLQDMFGKSDTWLSLVFNNVVVFWAGSSGTYSVGTPSLRSSVWEYFLLLLKQQGFVDGSRASWTAIFEAFVVLEEAKEHSNAYTLAIRGPTGSIGKLSPLPMALYRR